MLRAIFCLPFNTFGSASVIGAIVATNRGEVPQDTGSGVGTQVTKLNKCISYVGANFLDKAPKRSDNLPYNLLQPSLKITKIWHHETELRSWNGWVSARVTQRS